MASTELVSSMGKPKKKPTFGQYLGDAGRMLGDNALSVFGMNDVIGDDQYKSDFFRDTSRVTNKMYSMMGQVGATAIGGPAAGTAMGAVQQGLGQIGKPVGPGMFAMGGPLKPQSMMQAPVNDIPEFTPRTGLLLPKGYSELAPKLKFKERPRPNKVYAEGGLTKFEGPSHAEGGIQVGKDEVEGNETSMPMGEDQDFIFSEQINVPGTKSSFAKKSKSIESKYIRPNDPYEKKSMMAELGKLAKLQEAVKMFDGMQPEYNTEMTKKGMLVTPAKKMSFDKAAKKSSVSMDELAESMLAQAQQAQEQEQMQSQEMMPQEGMEGQQFATGGVWDPPTYEDYLIQQGENTPTMFDKPESLLSTNRGTKQPFRMNPISKPITGDITSNPNAWKAGEQVAPTLKGVSAKDSGGYESNFMIPALGYAAQALTNIPGLLAKPNYQNSPKVKFDDISLAEERNEARRSRNLGYATAQSMGGNDMGQTMNFMAGTTAALNSAYGQEFNRSLMQEEQANADINMREQMANSQIGMADADINARERDSAQALRMNALSNIGGVAAQAGKHYQASGQEDNYMNIMAQQGAGDYEYNYENRKFLNPKATMYRKKSSDGFEGGGVRRKDPLAGVTIGPQVGQEMGQTQRFGSGEYNWNDLYQRANPVDFREQIAPDDNTYQSFLKGPEIIAGSNTPKYRDSQVDRMADARTLPGYGVMNDRGMMSPTAQNWGQYPERVRADMASASVSDRADYGAIQDFEMAAAEFPAYLAGPGALGAIRRGKQARATVESATGIPKELAKRAPKVVNATKEVAKQGVGKWTNAGIGAAEGAAGYAMNQSDNPWIQGIGTATMGAGALRMLPALGYVAGQGFSKANWLKVPKWLKMQMPWLDDAGKVIAGAVTQAPEALALPLLGGAATLYNKKTGKTNEIRKEDKARKTDLNKFRGGGQ